MPMCPKTEKVEELTNGQESRTLGQGAIAAMGHTGRTLCLKQTEV